ncbi:uncharacterized protein SETTUDRAFT_162321 [Exserohilum turcica Et28A]|uniref:Uncharacterized protein n=1 Tax=Exserohilum turcicum (strain 28A) TaxID=671987 RepID=R0KVD1_EXST2|nr:uncharacterized protein SETTUDRAFT_162321 [Exserohilum turcica Et28A]EOA91702.1 hypothetical protein SETTUDRAFT_162321 [Exserohilum turcica Et28A]
MSSALARCFTCHPSVPALPLPSCNLPVHAVQQVIRRGFEFQGMTKAGPLSMMTTAPFFVETNARSGFGAR